MSESMNYRELWESGYQAFSTIKSDESLSPDEKTILIDLDPTIAQIRNEIANLFAEEDAEAERARGALTDEKDRG